jgi:hypothetical protein
VADKEAWKKRALLPEDKIDSNFAFHTSLLFKLSSLPMREGVMENKKLFIH